jgi:hypothetical protein
MILEISTNERSGHHTDRSSSAPDRKPESGDDIRVVELFAKFVSI